jgi:hypothetical protein
MSCSADEPADIGLQPTPPPGADPGIVEEWKWRGGPSTSTRATGSTKRRTRAEVDADRVAHADLEIRRDLDLGEISAGGTRRQHRPRQDHPVDVRVVIAVPWSGMAQPGQGDCQPNPSPEKSNDQLPGWSRECEKSEPYSDFS